MLDREISDGVAEVEAVLELTRCDLNEGVAGLSPAGIFERAIGKNERQELPVGRSIRRTRFIGNRKTK